MSTVPLHVSLRTGVTSESSRLQLPHVPRRREKAHRSGKQNVTPSETRPVKVGSSDLYLSCLRYRDLARWTPTTPFVIFSLGSRGPQVSSTVRLVPPLENVVSPYLHP